MTVVDGTGSLHSPLSSFTSCLCPSADGACAARVSPQKCCPSSGQGQTRSLVRAEELPAQWVLFPGPISTPPSLKLVLMGFKPC